MATYKKRKVIEDAEKRLVGKLDKFKRMYVDIADLHKDESRQRHTCEGRVLDMAENWNEGLYEDIIIHNRKGKLFVVDGVHRWLAADLIGKKKLRARVYDDLSLSGESDLFATINNARRSPSAVAEFLVFLKSDENVREIHSILKLHGLTVSRSPGAERGSNVSCVRELIRIHEKHGAETLERIVSIITRTWDRAEYARVKIDIFCGLAHIISNPKRWGNLDDARLIDKLIGITPLRLIGRGKFFKSETNETTAKCMAAAIIQEYNKGLRTQSKKLASPFGNRG